MKIFTMYEYHKDENGKEILDRQTTTTNETTVDRIIELYKKAADSFHINVISEGKAIYSK